MTLQYNSNKPFLKYMTQVHIFKKFLSLQLNYVENTHCIPTMQNSPMAHMKHAP